MARSEHLPIYKKAMDLAIYLEKVVRNSSRYHKYTLGSELRQKSRGVVAAIIAANSRVEKLPHLVELREKLEGLQVLLRLAPSLIPSATLRNVCNGDGNSNVRKWPFSDVGSRPRACGNPKRTSVHVRQLDPAHPGVEVAINSK